MNNKPVKPVEKFWSVYVMLGYARRHYTFDTEQKANTFRQAAEAKGFRAVASAPEDSELILFDKTGSGGDELL